MNDNVFNALFGARVRYFREKRGLTQKELSDHLGYTTHATISRIEKGVQTIPLSKLPDFCIALDVQPFDLLGLTENDKKIWIIAEQLEKENKNADLSKFIDLYLKLKETDQQNGVSDLD